MAAARPPALARCPWCRGRFTLPASATRVRLVRCPYCAAEADPHAGQGWQARAVEAVAVRAARLNLRLQRRLWALTARDLD